MSLIGTANMKMFEAGEIADFKARVEGIVGKPLEWNIDLESFNTASGGTFFETDYYTEMFHRFCFDRLEAVLTKFCIDPGIKAVINEKLKGISISQSAQEEVMQGVYTVVDGILVMHSPVIADGGNLAESIEGYLSQAINGMG